MSSLVKLGPPSIVTTLEAFYTKAILNIDFRSLYTKIGSIGTFEFLGFIIKAPGFPPLYILNTIQSPVLIGLYSNTKDIFQRYCPFEMALPPFFYDLYRDTFKHYREPLPEKGKVKCYYFTIGQDMVSFPSFAVIGQEKIAKGLMMKESIHGNEKMLLAGFFSEEAMMQLLTAFEKWNDKDVRFDFDQDLAIVSLRFSKDFKLRYSMEEYRTIAALIRKMIYEWYPGFFDLEETTPSFPDSTQQLVGFSLPFRNFARLLVNFNVFYLHFQSALDHISRYLSEQIKPVFAFFGNPNEIS
jgi:hypothetical protein